MAGKRTPVAAVQTQAFPLLLWPSLRLQLAGFCQGDIQKQM